MKFFQRVVNGVPPPPQHQSLDSYDDESSFQRKLSEDDSPTISSASSPVENTRTPNEQLETLDHKKSDKFSSLTANASTRNGASGKEPVWKRRARAHQASAPLVLSPQSNTNETSRFDSVETNRQTGPVDVDSVADEEVEEDTPDRNSSEQTYPHQVKDAVGNFAPVPSVQENSILNTTTDEKSRAESADEETPSSKTKGFMEKIMDPSFRKSVVDSKDKAWKAVLACHMPSKQKKKFPDDDYEDITKIDTQKTELPFWKMFSFSNEPQDTETSFESTSTTGSKELITMLKRAGTSLTGLVKETTAACTQPQHEEEDGGSFEDNSSNGSNFDSRAEGESKASTTLNNDERRLWQEFFEDDNENYSLGDEATNAGSAAGLTLSDRLKNAVSLR
ncbi:hypothetical protein FisN_3Lh561 [Fistulifera solaris]|uniref:Uncharacterized protein n=1 Tax=Fistulifera solaris TaxID=1519565 RepID=A0A1Z5J8Y1_FISSO|nr:hypothetical protein FisN_3Lh561 [Fistulifera solaris]|eukprot:GAX10352.1 hypothetical protein FisN_3Lh561 [Fistulifera solaris]